MENNTIHPDEMDRLLRETFLESDFPEKDSVTDLMAQHVYNTPWPAVPPLAKEVGIVAKKGFFAGFSLNTLIGGVLVVGLGVGTGTYLLTSSPDKTGEGKILAASQPLTESVEVASLPIPVLQPETAEAVVEKPVYRAPIKTEHTRPHGSSEMARPALPEAQKASVAATVRKDEPATAASKTEPSAPVHRRYILTPVISAAEALNNEKRKLDMIRQVLKQDKKEWAYIPTGTTTLNNGAVSVQAFYMMTHEVSNIQYRTFLYDLVLHNRLREYEKAAVYDSGWAGFGLESLVNYYFWHPTYNDYPVVNVSLEGAQLYGEWLTHEVNRALESKSHALINDIRLPTTEEWIYAAKADHDSAVYAWDGIYLRNARGLFLGNFHNSQGVEDYDGSDITAPVGEYFANDWGLYNLCGNVGEMTLPVQDGKVRVKGGSWSQPAEYMHLLHDNRVPVSKLATPSVGFRMVYTFSSP